MAFEAVAHLRAFPHRTEPQALAGGLQLAVGVREVRHDDKKCNKFKLKSSDDNRTSKLYRKTSTPE